MTGKRKPKGGPKRSPSGKGHTGKPKDPPKDLPKQPPDMPNRQGDNPPDKDEDDRLPPLVEATDDRPPPDPDPKITTDDDNAWNQVTRGAPRGGRGTEPRANEQRGFKPVADHPNTPRLPPLRTGSSGYSSRQKSPAETSDEGSRLTPKATPDFVKDGWSSSESEEGESIVVTESLKTGDDPTPTHQEIERVVRQHSRG
jgi:hypothetical protein